MEELSTWDALTRQDGGKTLALLLCPAEETPLSCRLVGADSATHSTYLSVPQNLRNHWSRRSVISRPSPSRLGLNLLLVK